MSESCCQDTEAQDPAIHSRIRWRLFLVVIRASLGDGGSRRCLVDSSLSSRQRVEPSERMHLAVKTMCICASDVAGGRSDSEDTVREDS